MGNLSRGGLCFECKRCSNCCRHSGYVFMSEQDIANLSAALNMTQNAFTQKYCKTVAGSGEIRISLNERPNGDCIFFDAAIGGCNIYGARPLQCRLYPFWERLALNKNEWQAEKQTCPGLDRGRRYSREEIKKFLLLRQKEPLIK